MLEMGMIQGAFWDKEPCLLLGLLILLFAFYTISTIVDLPNSISFGFPIFYKLNFYFLFQVRLQVKSSLFIHTSHLINILQGGIMTSYRYDVILLKNFFIAGVKAIVITWNIISNENMWAYV